MKKHNTLVPITLGFNTVVLIPESWTAFVYGGYIYRRNAFGRFVVGAKAQTQLERTFKNENISVSGGESACV